jgi:hypothetical protein
MKLAILLTAFVIVTLPAVAAESTAADLAVMRMEFAAKPGYNGYLLQIIEHSIATEANRHWDAGRVKETTDKLRELMDVYPLSILGNRMMGETYRNLMQHTEDSDQKKQLAAISKEHMDRYFLLVKSITGDSECSTPQDKCKVINIPEEQMVLWNMRCNMRKQAVVVEAGIPYDKLVAVKEDGSEKIFYFDISAFYNKSSDAAK